MKRSLVFIVAFGALSFLTTGVVDAQVLYSVTGDKYSQDFNTLPTSGTTNAWTNNSNLTGWWAYNSALGSQSTGRDSPSAGWVAVTNMRASPGTDTTGALYSFGSVSSTERALGSVESNTTGDFVIALILRNMTGETLNEFTLTYDGEQWRDRGGLMELHSLVFDYATFGALPGQPDLRGDNVLGYTAVPALNFTGPKATGTAGALDGNDPANRVAGITANVPLSWAPGDYLVLRWWNDNDAGSDHGLAIDNVSFLAVPEPGTLGLLTLGGLALLRRRRA
jgi:hypothetical protein